MREMDPMVRTVTSAQSPAASAAQLAGGRLGRRPGAAVLRNVLRQSVPLRVGGGPAAVPGHPRAVPAPAGGLAERPAQEALCGGGPPNRL